jgi:hypothetical protein
LRFAARVERSASRSVVQPITAMISCAVAPCSRLAPAGHLSWTEKAPTRGYVLAGAS